MLKKVLCILLVISCFPLWSCKEDTSTDFGFVDPETGIEYVMCDEKKLYAVTAGEEYITMGDVTYYTVQFEDPKKFLCVEDSGELLLYRAKDVVEPTLKEFDPIAAQIFSASNTLNVDNLYAGKEYLPDDVKDDAATDDTWICKLIAEHLTNGTVAEISPYYDEIENQYFIHLLSQDYPGLYYMVAFFKYQGRYYLMERNQNKIVYCPNDVIVRLVGSSQ